MTIQDRIDSMHLIPINLPVASREYWGAESAVAVHENKEDINSIFGDE